MKQLKVLTTLILTAFAAMIAIGLLSVLLSTHNTLDIDFTIQEGKQSLPAERARVIIYLEPPWWSIRGPDAIATSADENGQVQIKKRTRRPYSKVLVEVMTQDGLYARRHGKELDHVIKIVEQEKPTKVFKSAIMSYDGFTGALPLDSDSIEWVGKKWEMRCNQEGRLNQ